MRFRFLIVDMMLLIVPCAVAFAVVHEDPESLGHIAFAFYLAAICLAFLGAKFRRGNRRHKMFWKGFAVFGWIYFVIGLWAGQAEAKALLIRSALGLAFAAMCGYLSLRLVTKDPCPGLRRAEGNEPGTAPAPAETVDFNLRSA
jgi:hypothetical protein